ncbi:MAG: hypothetical protein HY957_02905 [Nitrospirae bacterium]|nr:hypothetical protein [Nitrospirota bacterium]
MKTLIEKALIEALLVYMEKKGIRQNELARRLGWSPPDLNDILRGRKNIGKNRQAFLEAKLGAAFKHELLLKISELAEAEKKMPVVVATRPSELIAGKYILTDMEQGYVDKLLAILRGINQHAKLAIKANIDILYRCKRKRQDINEGYIRQLLEENKS